MRLRIILLVSLICLLTLMFSCAPKSTHLAEGNIPPISEEGSGDFHGTWIQNDKWDGCTYQGKDTWTIKIIQQGDAITLVNVDRNHVYKGIARGNKIILKGIEYSSRYGGNTIVDDYELTMSEDKKTLKGTMYWTWDIENCRGETQISCVRKMEK